MLLVASVLSLIVGVIGFTVTKTNARYLLSGYNTLSEQEQQALDLEAYLRFFKRFHLTLALSLLLGVWGLRLVNNNWASLFMTLYPLGAYGYFLLKGASFYKGSTRQGAGTYLAGGALLLVMGLAGSLRDYKSSELVLGQKSLEITGSYGLSLAREQVYGQALVEQLPPIAYKVNGFAAGDYAKGRFKVKGGAVVWLFVNKGAGPFLRLKTARGEIYYNHDELAMDALSKRLAQWLNAGR
ncbi:DUF3784 domain-containing protein [Fibrella forsythiae]|uniref:DUF3784 domain-containing protein n=1 Tax=Fibrella forsythiae TaxID=2817061 RepID=A0ABS3JSV9_9BACT|nr:DUF3784 domain-containing protein [Fibrella forsythiae]MBO0953096.1 DUF3784 domain-containing protein [Fibrella forsythiae]